MARIYPEGGPAKERIRDAERRIYDLLRDQLDENYTVFHSAPWNTKDEDERIRYGEVDFVVLHPTHGILLLEVKGGGISYDGAVKAWASRDRYGIIHPIQDPYLQVSNSMFALKRHLQNTPLTNPFARQYRISHGVWFPDIQWTPGSVSLPHVVDDLTLDTRDLAHPQQSIERIFAYFATKKQRPLDEKACSAFIDVFALSGIIRRSIIGDQIRDEERQFKRLTDDQFRKLDIMSRHPRVSVRGAAGTGKTVLALTKAQRCAAQGLDVLFVCANPSLAQWIKGVLAQERDEIRDHILVQHVEELCVHISGLAGVALGDLDDVAFGDHEELGVRTQQAKLAGLLSRSLRRLTEMGKAPAYDVILVDEAQDIERPLWTPLYTLLRDRRNGLFFAFYDPAQREGEDDWTPPIVSGARELVLSENCRNTQTIFRVAQEFYTGFEAPRCLGPEGRPIVCLDPASVVAPDTAPEEVEAQVLAYILDRLVEREQIAPEDILVITGQSQEKSRLFKRKSIGAHLLSPHSALKKKGFVTITTIRSAKGLESNVVILAELDAIRLAKRRDTYLYIALSRAVHHLVVIGTKENLLPRQPSLARVAAEETGRS